MPFSATHNALRKMSTTLRVKEPTQIRVGMYSSKIAGKIKSQITLFSHKLSGEFKKPLRKFLVQLLYGIQASKDVKLSNIARSLNEEIPLI